MRKRLIWSLVTAWLALCAAPVAAVTVIVPKANATSTSSAASNAPFGNNASTSFTMQLQFAAAQLSTIARGSLLTQIGFRLYSYSGTIAQALNYTSFDVQVGSATTSIANLSRTFSANQGADTITARSGPLTIAAGTFKGNARVNPFYTIDLTTPYVYNGGDLVLTIQDALAADTQNVFVSLDAVYPSSVIGSVGGADAGAARGTANFFSAPVTQLTFAAAAVPEGATWAMMVIGFGLMGVALRRSKGMGAPSFFA